MVKNLKTLATFGVLWNGISQFSTQVFQFIVIIILARLLSPEDFGIVGLVTLFTGLITVINELGLSAAIIQRKDVNDVHISTSFWSSIFMGVTLCILTIILSPLVANFFHEDLVRPVLMVSSIGLIIGSFGIIQRALLEKSLNFKSITIVEVCASIGSGIVSILLAIKGFGVWSIVAGSISTNIISVIALWKLSTWRPSLQFSMTHFRELFKFGGHVAGSNLLNYVAMKVDYLIIGKVLGTTSLGYYSLARMLTSFPVQKVSWTVMRVAFSAFSKIQDNKNAMKTGYLTVTRYISLITFPMLAGMFVVAPEFIMTFYGEKWNPIVILIQILCFEGIIVSISAITGTVLYSKGRSDMQFKWQIFTTIMMTISVLIGSNYGIVGVAIAFTIMMIALSCIIQYLINRIIGINMMEYVKEIVPATICSIALIVLVIIYKMVINSQIDTIEINVTTVLLSSIFIGTIIYIMMILKFYGSIFNEMMFLVREMRG